LKFLSESDDCYFGNTQGSGLIYGITEELAS
jgi:hypothetical protein